MTERWLTNTITNVYSNFLLFFSEPTELEEEKENPNQTIYQGKYMKAVITRKENFVPYTTQIYTYLTSLMDETKSEK